MVLEDPFVCRCLCGGSNVQLAVNPKDGAMVINEMNPVLVLCPCLQGYRLYRQFAAKLAMGFTLTRSLTTSPVRLDCSQLLQEYVCM
jgi:carbamoylphosphate synthase large subunit